MSVVFENPLMLADDLVVVELRQHDDVERFRQRCVGSGAAVVGDFYD